MVQFLVNATKKYNISGCVSRCVCMVHEGAVVAASTTDDTPIKKHSFYCNIANAFKDSLTAPMDCSFINTTFRSHK